MFDSIVVKIRNGEWLGWFLLLLSVLVVVGYRYRCLQQKLARDFGSTSLTVIYDAVMNSIVRLALQIRGNWWFFKLSVWYIATEPWILLRKDRLQMLRNRLFRGVAHGWTGLTCGSCVQHRSGEWYNCFMTNGFNYSSLKHKIPSVVDNTINEDEIRAFERRAADVFDSESAVLFFSGFQANLTLATGLEASFSKPSMFLWDSQSHRSTFEGLKTLRNESFRHNDPTDLESRIIRYKDLYTIVVLVEGKYSMSGDVPPSESLNRLKKTHGFFLAVDQAHSIGVLGSDGMDRSIDADLRLVVLSKFAGCFGSLILGSHKTLLNIRLAASAESRRYPRSSLEVLHGVLDSIIDGTVANNCGLVQSNAEYAYHRLICSGWTPSSKGNILVFPVGSSHVAFSMQQWCIQRGVYFTMIAYPAVPSKFDVSFRVCITASMTAGAIDRMVSVLSAFKTWKGMPRVKPASPVPSNRLGNNSARNLGGSTLETSLAEAAIAQKAGYDVCKYTICSELSIRYWKRLFGRTGAEVTIVNDLEEAHKTGSAVVCCPIQPSGVVMLCQQTYWRPEFVIEHPCFVFTTSIPPHVWWEGGDWRFTVDAIALPSKCPLRFKINDDLSRPKIKIATS